MISLRVTLFQCLTLLLFSLSVNVSAADYVCESGSLTLPSANYQGDRIIATDSCESVTIVCENNCKNLAVYAAARVIDISCGLKNVCEYSDINIGLGSELGVAAYNLPLNLSGEAYIDDDFDGFIESFSLSCDAKDACLGLNLAAYENIQDQTISCSELKSCQDSNMQIFSSSVDGSINIICSGGTNSCQLDSFDVVSGGASFSCVGADCAKLDCPGGSAGCDNPVPIITGDSDADGQSDYYDDDNDGDGIADVDDAYPDDPSLPVGADVDSDSDGLSDALEAINGTNPNLVEDSSKDSELSISPRFHIFGDEVVNAVDCESSSLPVIYSVENVSASVQQVTSISIQGSLAEYQNEFKVLTGSDLCSGSNINAGEVCQFSVVYCPVGEMFEQGSSAAALLQLATSSTVNPVLESAMASHEGAQEQAQRRIPPVVSGFKLTDSLSQEVASNALSENSSYTLEFSVAGYHSGYSVAVVLFDCSLVGLANCGLSFSYMLDNSGFLSPVLQGAGNWSYGDLSDQEFTYQYTFTTPVVAATTDLVLRFYQKSSKDVVSGKSSLSLMVPGNLSVDYLGVSGRRLMLTINNDAP